MCIERIDVSGTGLVTHSHGWSAEHQDWGTGTPKVVTWGWLYDGFFGGLLWFIMDNDGLLMFIKVYDSGGLPHEEVYSFYKTDWFLLWFIDVYDMG